MADRRHLGESGGGNAPHRPGELRTAGHAVLSLPKGRPSSTASRYDQGKRGARGYDAGKKISVRKRHIEVDTTGLLVAVVVHAANIQDRDGAKLVLAKLLGRFPRLQVIWADAAYAGRLVAWALVTGGWLLTVVW